MLVYPWILTLEISYHLLPIRAELTKTLKMKEVEEVDVVAEVIEVGEDHRQLGLLTAPKEEVSHLEEAEMVCLMDSFLKPQKTKNWVSRIIVVAEEIVVEDSREVIIEEAEEEAVATRNISREESKSKLTTKTRLNNS